MIGWLLNDPVDTCPWPLVNAVARASSAVINVSKERVIGGIDDVPLVLLYAKFDALRLGFAWLFDDVHCAMRTFVWYKDPKAVCALMSAIYKQAQTSTL